MFAAEHSYSRLGAGRGCAELTAQFVPDLLNGVEIIKGRTLIAIPYYAWANRGRGEMAVWIAAKGGE